MVPTGFGVGFAMQSVVVIHAPANRNTEDQVMSISTPVTEQYKSLAEDDCAIPFISTDQIHPRNDILFSRASHQGHMSMFQGTVSDFVKIEVQPANDGQRICLQTLFPKQHAGQSCRVPVEVGEELPTLRRTKTPAKRDPNLPTKAQQRVILSAISEAKSPQMGKEIAVKLRLSPKGKIRHYLGWMTTNKILKNIPGRGYWPAEQPEPE
ncbi:MAG: hypothetical protein U0792_05215 [Gemmataceae bacterium]